MKKKINNSAPPTEEPKIRKSKKLATNMERNPMSKENQKSLPLQKEMIYNKN